MIGNFGTDYQQPVAQGLDLPDGLDEDEVKQVVQQELQAALGQDGGSLAQERLQAQKYFAGEPLGNEVEGRSQLVFKTVLEAVEWALPALLRIFTASDQICIVDPPRPGLEARAAQASEYLNHIFHRDNPGFMILHDWLFDALLEKVGWVKYWWNTQKTVESKTYTGLTQEQYDALLGQDADVEVVKIRRYAQDADEFNMDRPQVPPPPPLLPPMPPLGPPVPPLANYGLTPTAPGINGSAISAARFPGSAASSPPRGMPLPPPPGAVPLSMSPPSPPPVELIDVTLRITREHGRAVIENVPPEEILFSRRAKRDDIPYLCHRRRWTRSDLIQQGYDEASLEDIPANESLDWNQERVERHRLDDDTPQYERTDAGEHLWIEENYVQLSRDGKAGRTTELYKVMTAGNGRVILTRDGEPCIDCVDEAPFVSVTPIPMSHRLVGMSLADLVMDLQYVKSVIMRQMLDNAYLSNWPRIEVGDDSVNENTYDDLLTLRPGGIVRTKRLGGISPMMIPYTADKTFPLVQYLDTTAELRTGVAREGSMITADALNNTAASSIAMLQQAAGQRIELFARIFAHGVEKLMRGVMELVRKNQQQERIIRVTGGYLTVDPREWRDEMPVTVSVGLGTGNRDQVLAHLMQVIQIQGTIVQQQGGVTGPLVYAKDVYAALHELTTNAGFKTSFFSDPSMPPPPGSPPPGGPQKPDPVMIKAQAAIQALQLKAQAEAQQSQQKAQLEAQLQQQQAQAEAGLAQQKLQHELMLEERRLAHEMELERQKSANDILIARAQMEAQNEVRLQEVRLKYAAGAYAAGQGIRPPEANGGGNA